MRRTILLLMTTLVGCATAYDLPQTRTLLEKQLFYVSKGKIGSCKYWALHLGAHDCDLRRKFPGEDTIEVEATMNFDMISSGYVDGSGYCARGKVKCLTDFHLATADTAYRIDIDSIDYAYDYCDKVVLTTGEKDNLRTDADGKLARPKHLLLRIYHMVDYYGAEVLRPKAEVNISAFAFSKKGIRQALAAQKRLKAAKE